MRRATELKSKKIKKEIDMSTISPEETSFKELNKDILYILQGYESRIKIKTKTKRDSNIFKPSYERYMLHTNPKEFTLDIYPFINLQTLIIKNCSELNLDLLSCRAIKTVYISNVKRIILQKQLQIEELYLKNTKVNLDVLLKILASPILKSINLNGVEIIAEDVKMFENLTNTERISINENITDQSSNDGITFFNASQHMMSFTSIDEMRYREYNNEIQNNQIMSYISDIIASKIEHNVNIKACSFISTNILLNSLIKTNILHRLHSFTYVKDTEYVFVSYNTSTFNLLETNIELDCKLIDFVNIEKISFNGFSMFKTCDFGNIKSLELQNISICSNIIDNITSRFQKLSEIGFVCCNFNNNSFYKMIDLLKNKIRKLNLKDSLIPLNSLEFLKEKLTNCKVIFKNGNIFFL